MVISLPNTLFLSDRDRLIPGKEKISFIARTLEKTAGEGFMIHKFCAARA